MNTELEYLKQENAKLKMENELLKKHMYFPKIMNNIFDYFIWINKNISETIEQLDNIHISE